ncbi:MAG: thermonuclease family protein, partial [Firmicutes bacterium]|nr:thermonuclease family protein [Bacillota bacterium]
MKKFSLLISSLAILATALVGCGETSSSSSIPSSSSVSSSSSSSEIVSSSSSSSSSSEVILTPADLNTDQTDAFHFTADYAGKNFIADGIGEVFLKSNTDGDTAAFYTKADHTESVKCRFLGINTPESTGKVQPWGNAASAFTKGKLLDATKIVLINDVPTFGQLDSSGGRYLGFVWYIPSTGTEFRL